MKKAMMAVFSMVLTMTATADAVTDLQFENAKKVAFEMVEKIARQREAIVLVARPGWKLTSVNPKKTDPRSSYKAVEIPNHRGQNRVAVTTYINAISPAGKIDWFAGGNYRILVDLNDDGEVIAAELNYFSSLMSYDEATPVTPSRE